MSKRILIAISVLGLSSAAVLAQTVTPPVTAPAEATPKATVPVAAQPQVPADDAKKAVPADVKAQGKPMSAEDTPPLSGANSFTETQARERVMQTGFTTVDALKKDASGVWRGTGTKGGKTVSVAVDFKGNIVVTQ
jgi:putative membrane protein